MRTRRGHTTIKKCLPIVSQSTHTHRRSPSSFISFVLSRQLEPVWGESKDLPSNPPPRAPTDNPKAPLYSPHQHYIPTLYRFELAVRTNSFERYNTRCSSGETPTTKTSCCVFNTTAVAMFLAPLNITAFVVHDTPGENVEYIFHETSEQCTEPRDRVRPCLVHYRGQDTTWFTSYWSARDDYEFMRPASGLILRDWRSAVDWPS